MNSTKEKANADATRGLVRPDHSSGPCRLSVAIASALGHAGKARGRSAAASLEIFLIGGTVSAETENIYRAVNRVFNAATRSARAG